MKTHQEKIFKAKVDTLFITLLSIVSFNIAIFYFFELETISNVKSSLFYQILLFNTISFYILIQLFRKCNLPNLIYRYQHVILANFFIFLSFQTWKKIYIHHDNNLFILLICIFLTALTMYQIKTILFLKR